MENTLEQFERALTYALEINTPKEVLNDLINSIREGMANRKRIDTPYLVMTEIKKYGKSS